MFPYLLFVVVNVVDVELQLEVYLFEVVMVVVRTLLIYPLPPLVGFGIVDIDLDIIDCDLESHRDLKTLDIKKLMFKSNVRLWIIRILFQFPRGTKITG